MRRFAKFAAIAVIAVIAIGAALVYAFYMPLPASKARTADGTLQTVSRDGRTIAYHVRGNGPRVLLAASAGREASDFNELTAELVEAGYRTIAVEAPGIGGSDMMDEGASLANMAKDLIAALESDCGEERDCRAFSIGHAFGNRTVRAMATAHPERIDGVVLIAAGGVNQIDERANQALFNAFDPRRTREQRKEDIRYAFFADGNPIPDYWIRGWHRHTAILQDAASSAMPDDSWLAAGGRPILVVQADADRIAPKEDTADVLQRDYPDQVTVALIENAGHALLPERPTRVAEAVIGFLNNLREPAEASAAE